MDSIDKFSNHHFFRRGSHQPMRERFHAGRGGMSRQTNFEAGIGGTRRGDCHAGRTRPAEGPKDSALLVFRRHVAQSLSVSFKAAPASEAYSDEAASPGQSAGEVLGAANQIVQGSGESRESTIVRIRQHVHEAAEVAHTSAGDADDAGDVDKAVSLIDGGLESMARGAGASEGIESSELALYASSRRRSTISIRTQEGDFVRLQVSNKTQMGAYDSYESTDEGSSTQTEIALSSRSKVRISVQGDLNEGELAAIREVFTQAEAVAEEFFGGDLQAAFDLSSGLSFDASQLARIRLRFSAVERSAAAYEQIGSGITGSVPDSVPAATAGGPGPNPAVANTEGSGAGQEAQPGATAEEAAAIATTPETEAGEASETVVPGNEVAVGAEETAATEDSPFAAFFESLSQFLTATIDGLGQLQGGFDLSAGGSFRLTTHFKLEVLKSVMVQAAPEDRREGAAQAGEAVSDALLGSGSAPAESANAQDPTAVV